MKDTNCVHIRRSLNVDADGKTRICCMSKLNLQHNNKVINIAEDSIQEAWDSEGRAHIISALESGLKHENCDFCWTEEQAGRTSKRLRDQEIYNIPAFENQPVVLDLKMGNLCNLKCRTCGSHSSSKWIEEEYNLDFKHKTRSLDEFKQGYKTFSQSFADENPSWEVIKGWGNEIKFLDFYGGEPMLIRKHWDFLEHSVATGASKGQVLHYNTNSTIFPEAKVHLYENFKGLDISLSIDGYEKSFEYIRHPGKWSEIKANCLKWIDFFEKLKIDFKKINITLTISLYNIFDLDTIHEELSKLGLNIYLNLVHLPDYLCIANLPVDYKDVVYKKLKKSESLMRDNNSESILNFMMQTNPSEKLFDVFIKKVKAHDSYRKENFASIFPEYFELIKEKF